MAILLISINVVDSPVFCVVLECGTFFSPMPMVQSFSSFSFGHPACSKPTLSTRAAEDTVSTVVQVLCIAASRKAFAFWRPGGDRAVVATWDNWKRTIGVHKLKNNQNIQQIEGAMQDVFFALLGDGSIRTGDPYRDPHRDFTDKLLLPFRNVRSIHTTSFGLAVLHHDGTVMPWGMLNGGESIESQLRQVEEIVANTDAFAALLQDHTVVTWGNPGCGGDSSAVQDQLQNVREIHSTDFAFAALRDDRTVVTWGQNQGGGDSSSVQHQLKHVKKLGACNTAFVAILQDGSAVTWGETNGHSDIHCVKDQLKDVQQICGSSRAFAGVLSDGRVVTWGHPDCGGDSSFVQEQLVNVQEIKANQHAFLALRSDGRVVTWGNRRERGDCSHVIMDEIQNL